jgi:hypothetical protein
MKWRGFTSGLLPAGGLLKPFARIKADPTLRPALVAVNLAIVWVGGRRLHVVPELGPVAARAFTQLHPVVRAAW